MNDPPINPDALRLEREILLDLESLPTLKGKDRDAVLSRLASKVGELVKLAERDPPSEESVHHEATGEQDWVYQVLFRLSWELLKRLGNADFYLSTPTTSVPRHAFGRLSHPRVGAQALPRGRRPEAA